MKIPDHMHKLPLLQFGLILIVIAFLLFIPNDPDFPWHLKYGELTFSQGPISHDPFSHTFSEYQFFDYQWLSHVLIYAFYKIGGIYAISLFYGSIVLSSFLIAVNIPLKKNVSKTLKLLILLFALIICKPVIGIRPQMATILGASLVYFFLVSFLKKPSRSVFFIPLIILIWTNLHPGFLSGIILISLTIFGEIVKIVIRKNV